MKIMGCDFHPSFQQIAMVDSETGRFCSRRKRCFHQLYCRNIAESDRQVKFSRERDEVARQCAASTRLGCLRSYNEPEEPLIVGGMP
jgi:hypothetical protein